MKVYNLIELVDNKVIGIENFIVFDEQLDEVYLEECKVSFEQKLKEVYGEHFSQEYSDICFEEKYWEDDNGYKIQIVTSYFQD